MRLANAGERLCKITNAGSDAIGVGDDGKGEEQPAPEPKRRAKKAAEPGRARRSARRKKSVRPLHDGARDSHALLLARVS